jgi:hypothetical protein
MSRVKKALRQVLTEEVSVPVEVAGRALGIRRPSAYNAIRSGELPHIKIGHRIAVPTAWLRRQLQIEDPRI